MIVMTVMIVMKVMTVMIVMDIQTGSVIACEVFMLWLTDV